MESYTTDTRGEDLVRKFYAYPVKNLIVNVIAAILYGIFFYLLMTGDSSSFTTPQLCVLFGGCLFSLIANRILASQTQKAVAREAMAAFKTAKDTSDNPYYYLYRKEYELYGCVRKGSGLVFVKLITFLLQLFNLFFSLYAGLLPLAASLAILVIVGGISVIAQIIFKAGGANGASGGMLRLGKAATIPLKYTLKFFGYILIHQFKDINIGGGNKWFSGEDGGEDVASSDAVTVLGTDPKSMGRTQSELQIDGYLSVPSNSDVFPNANYARWSGTPSIVARGSSVTFTGVIVADPTVYVTQADREQLLDKCRDNVSRALSSQVDRFLSDYPNAQKARIEIELTLK